MARHKLTPQQRRRRRIRAERAALYDPTQQLSGAGLRRAANQITGLQYNGQKAALDREAEQATRQGGELAARTSDYYKQLAKSEAGNVARQQAIGNQLRTRLQGLGQEAQQGISMIASEADQRAQQDQAVRGAGLSGGGQDRVAEEIAAQRGLALQGSTAAQVQGEQGTANWANLANIAAMARGMQGGESLQRVQNALGAQQADIRGRQTDLAGQIANARAKNVLDLRQQSYENIVTQQGLGIDMAKIRSQAQQARADQRLAGRRIRSAERQNAARLRTQRRGQDVSAFTQRRGQDLSARERQLDRSSREKIAASRKSRVGKNEPADSRKARREVGNILSAIETQGIYRGQPKAEVIRKLTRRGATPLGAEIGYQLHIRGWLGPELERRARAAGIRIPKAWKHPGGPYGSGIPHNKV